VAVLWRVRVGSSSLLHAKVEPFEHALLHL